VADTSHPVLPRVVAGAAIVFVVSVLALVQFASDAIYASRSVPGAVPSRLHVEPGVEIYRAIDRVAPAPYVLTTLATVALSRGDADAAEHYAVQMPESPMRDELLARVALARGQNDLANEYFFVAGDIQAMEPQIYRLGQWNHERGLDLARRFRERLIALGTHPDAVAELYYESGEIASWTRHGPRSLAFFEKATSLAPLNMKYVLSTANEAMAAGDSTTARRYYRAGWSADPDSPEFLAGLGLVALRSGDRAQARRYLIQARTIDPNAVLVRALERDLE
jgi:tetratricopeptide (TPR) repeat protein